MTRILKSVLVLAGFIFFSVLIIIYVLNNHKNSDKYKKIRTRKHEELLCNDILEKDILSNNFIEINYENPKNAIDNNTKNQYYELLKSINTILTNNNLPYALCAGTLLGSYRHRDIIPWDDDADICIKFEDHKKLMNLEKEFKKQGIHLQAGCLACWFTYYEDICKYCNLQAKKGHREFIPINMQKPCESTPYFATFSKGEIHVDIFHVIPIIDKYHRTMYSISGNNRLISKSQYDKLFNTVSCEFGDVILRCPSNTKELLCYEYKNNLTIPTKNQMENKSAPGMGSNKEKNIPHFEIKNDEIIINNFKS